MIKNLLFRNSFKNNLCRINFIKINLFETLQIKKIFLSLQP